MIDKRAIDNSVYVAIADEVVNEGLCFQETLCLTARKVHQIR